VKQLDGTGMKRLHREWRRRTRGRLGLVVDDVQGPFNVGAIIRTAAALRVDDVWLAGARPSPTT
jgi:tRNA (guanosine-2'-O-)-methyltransferase